MSEMEEKLGAILNNPQMMQQIMSMAQAMGSSQPSQSPPPKPQESSPALPMDPRSLQALAGFAQKSGVDRNQQTLLKALCPYLSKDRINKLERAMRAAKLAGLASNLLNSGALQMLAGR